MSTVEYVCVFVRASGDRLLAAERLVLALPQLAGAALQDLDLRYQDSAKLLGVFVRLRGEALPREARDRLAFWTARAGGRAMALEGMSADDRARVDAYLSAPTREQAAVTPAALLDVAGGFFTELGAPPERQRSATERPALVMDVGGPGWEGVSWSAEDATLFVAAPLAPPAGDEVPVRIRIPGTDRPVQVRASVSEVRTPAQAAPGHPAGYALRLERPPPALVDALSHAAPRPGADSRIAPRFQVNAPVKVTKAAEPRREVAPTRAFIEYATDQELAADFVENLSQGGAFVRTASPAPVGTPVALELKLPNGAELRARAIVAFVKDGGMGVRFELDAESEAQLAAAMAHISARPRRALVVDDDETVRRILADALRERGFEVLTAGDAGEGMSLLAEELLALDLLVTDAVMPGMSGEEFVRLIRKTGGEVDLAIVCVSGQLDGDGTEARLESAGADAVLDKSLGPDLIAQAADAVVERKRLVAHG